MFAYLGNWVEKSKLDTNSHRIIDEIFSSMYQQFNHSYCSGYFLIFFFLSAKKAGLKGNARTLIWIHSLREKAAAVESMLHKLQSLTIALKRKQQLGGGSKRNDYSAIAVATAIAGAGNVISKPTNTTSFSSSMESSSTSTKR